MEEGRRVFKPLSIAEDAGRKKSVTLLEAEGTIGYCRPMLPQFMAGQVEEEKLFYLKPGEDPLLKVRTGVKVQSLDRKTQTLHLENQERIGYERLILAPGDGRSSLEWTAWILSREFSRPQPSGGEEGSRMD